MKRCAVTFFISVLCALLPAIAQESTITHCQYWFDYEQMDVFTVPYDNADTFQLSLDTKDMPIGIHRLYFRFKDSEGTWGPLHGHCFFVGELSKIEKVSGVTAGEYWVDGDYDNRQVLGITQEQCVFSFDASSLREGLHTLSYRVKDDIGNYSPLQTWCFLRERIKQQIPSSVKSVEYWVDNNVDALHSKDLSNGTIEFAFDASSLREGLHTLSYRVKDDIGNYSPLQTWCFLRERIKQQIPSSVKTVEYWVDNNVDALHSKDLSNDTIEFAFDASSLREGLHTLSYRIKDNIGNYSPLQTWCFLRERIKQQIPSSVKTVEYWVDNNVDALQSKDLSNDTVEFAFDASSLREGLHTLSYRVKDNIGNYSPLQTWCFMRERIKQQIPSSVKTVEYWVDNNVDALQSKDLSNDTIEFVFDASSLREGLHTLSYRVKDDIGNNSALHTWMFYKSSNIGKASRIRAYQYWWNNHTDKIETVSVTNDSAVFVFDEQLNVPEYAKNDGFTANSYARFQIVFIDDIGKKSGVEWVDVAYPDVYPPISTITITNQTPESVSLSWSANEDEIEDYNIYYSENDQPFVLWLPNTTTTNAVFALQPGMSYRFTVTARDKSGNRELLDETKYVMVNNTNE